MLGPDRAEGRAPTVALALTQDPAKVAKALAERGIIAGASDFYAHRVLEGMGVGPEAGVLRLSFTHYTNQGEMDKLLNALDDLL